MDVLKSSEFRKRYASLTRETIVVVNGHPIGLWRPNTSMEELRKVMTPPGSIAVPLEIDPTSAVHFRPVPKPKAKAKR